MTTRSEAARPTPATPVQTLSPLTLALLLVAAIVVVAMIVLGVTLLQQIGEIEDNQQLSENLVIFSERPYTAVQRDVLRLAVLIEDENSAINDVRNLRAVVTNHMTRLTLPEQVAVRSDAVNNATQDLLVLWAGDTQNAITDFINAPVRDEQERAVVIGALQQFERDLNAISVQNELDRQESAAQLDTSTINVLDTMRNVLTGLGATGALLLLFAAGVTLSIARSTQQVIRLNNVLDQRVRERTRDLQTATDVSQQITTLLDIDALVARVAAETVARYSLDAVLVGLVDEDAGNITIVASSDAQTKPFSFETPPQISIDARPSVIARAARERTNVIVSDVKSSPDYLALKGLPDVKTEAVIPMVIGRRTVGVFDLYSNDPDRFTPETINALRIVANQTAVAVQNARLYAEATTARQEAETANKAKSQFLAAMSHELRTPMNSVLNFTQFVSSGMLGDVNDEQKDALDKGHASGEHLLNLINDVLDISKIESDALQLYIERDIDLDADILKPVADMGESLTKNQPIEFELHKDDDLPHLLGDKQRIRQIVLNLAGNACKFTQEGHVKVHARRKGDDHITITVNDTGPGIPADQQEKIFELFSQTKIGLRRGGGTGLGLPIARRLAEAHAGTLTVESEVGKGSTFTLTLPVTPDTLEKQLLAEEASE
jgi:signal transduction histidine kinase